METGVVRPLLTLWVLSLVAAAARRTVVDGIVKSDRNAGSGRSLIVEADVEVGTPEAGVRGGAA